MHDVIEGTNPGAGVEAGLGEDRIATNPKSVIDDRVSWRDPEKSRSMIR